MFYFLYLFSTGLGQVLPVVSHGLALSIPGKVLVIFHLVIIIISKNPHDHNTPLLIFMHDVIILTQNEAIGARPPPLAVAAPMASFWVRVVTYSCITSLPQRICEI